MVASTTADEGWDAIWVDASLATLDPGNRAPFGRIEDGVIAVKAGLIAHVGARDELPRPAERMAAVVHDAEGAWLTPALIDCHTHIVHGGHRACEFDLRLQGASYADISQSGGGIRSTVMATRAASFDELFETAARRLGPLVSEGVTVVEIKSGYGLDLDTELKMLEVARALGRRMPVKVVTTFLGAHAVPSEFEGGADRYIDFVCDEVLPAAVERGLVDQVDAFCEGIAFTPQQVGRVFDVAHMFNLPIKLHAEQLSDLGGSILAANAGALSCDHLEFVGAEGIGAMARAGTVAVLLPGAFFTLGETVKPPIAAFRKAGVRMAVATDCNPGSSPVTSLLTTMNMACVLFGLTPEEALAGATREAAHALGLAAERGTLTVGKAADFVLWRIQDPAELSYRIGLNPRIEVIRAGAPTLI